MSGWIKLHRQVSNNSLWTSEPFTRGQAWIDLLMIANFKDSYYFKRGVRVDVKRGEIGRSTVELADRWKWSRGKVNRFLSLLEKEEQIVQQKMNVTTLISIVNYDTYQQDDTASVTPKVQQTGSKRTHIKNDKKEKKDNITIKSVSSPPDGVDALYFYIAKGYHKMFYDYKGSKSLEDAELDKWVNTIRLLVEVDKVTIPQLIAVKQFLQAGINKQRGVDSFWSDTIYSLNALRKKSKDGVYQFDRIKQAAKNWLAKNPQQEAIVYQAEIKLMERANGQ